MANAKRRRKGKGSSKAGRPKKTGDRYACGKLRPTGPNETVIAKRKAGDASAGEHPLDFALSNGWITERMHKDAMAYRAAFNRTQIRGPGLCMGGMQEAPEPETLRTNWSELSDSYISELFDKVFSEEPAPEVKEQQDAQSLARWRALNVALSPEERHELFLVCVVGSWPFWMPKQAGSHALGAKDILKRETLFCGLKTVGRAMRPPKSEPNPIQAAPFKRTRVGRAESAVRYETEEGIEVAPLSERGIPFEVTILRRRVG